MGSPDDLFKIWIPSEHAGVLPCLLSHLFSFVTSVDFMNDLILYK